MFNSYTFNIEGDIVTNDEKTIVKRENHSQIEEELRLENDIEALNTIIKEQEEFLNNWTLEGAQKRKKRHIIKTILTGVCFVIFVEFIGNTLGLGEPVKNPSLPLIKDNTSAMISLFLTLYIPGAPLVIRSILRAYKRDKKEIEETQILHDEYQEKLKEKEQELATIKNNKVGKLTPDDVIHNLNGKEVLPSLRKDLEAKKEIIRKLKIYEELASTGELNQKILEENISVPNQEFIYRLVKSRENEKNATNE